MIRVLLMMTLAIGAMTNQSSGQDEKKKKGKKGQRNQTAQLLGRYKDVGVNEEQESKMKKIIKEFSAKMQDLRKEANKAFPAEARKARQAAGKKARAEGLKGKDLQAAINKAAPVPEAAVATQKKLAEMTKELRTALDNVLTDEQKAKLPKKGGKGKGKKKKKDE
ncbi:MAG: hypothetical protein VX768_05375 [Planctomycetota bacterium]|nr:hypothetical protein [Planctomycetota bacterium]